MASKDAFFIHYRKVNMSSGVFISKAWISEPGIRRRAFPLKDVYRNKTINFRLEIAITCIGLLITFVSTIFSLTSITRLAQGEAVGKIFELITFSAIILFMIYGNVLYQITRIGYFRRLLKHSPADWNHLNSFFAEDAPSLAILIPSYKEELRVIRQSILSSALQEYPRKSVVLLIDDPAHPRSAQDLEGLMAARCLPLEIQDMLSPQARRMAAHRDGYLSRKDSGKWDCFDETIYLSVAYEEVANWYLEKADSWKIIDHTDELFVEKIFREPYRHYARLAVELETIIMEGRRCPGERYFDLAYHKLARKFEAEIMSFERKRYENLSHEPNKAMNLNSYIGCMGKSLRQVRRQGKLYLEETDPLSADIRTPRADFLITLDADSILSFDYAIRLVDVMSQPGNERLAVAQTPYSAVPNPSSLLERVAGATTDMQYLIHQGFTCYRATYWVGANALLRVNALDDIRETVMERGYRVCVFIQDRTVIEDTESSVDLVARGWSLYNYPERLSYSATPVDFGSLLIQRRRWANGGLIIFPKLWRYLSRNFNYIKKFSEGFMRIHYLISIAAVNIGLPVIMFCFFDDRLNIPWLPLTALPYYFFYGRDLIHAGYKLCDLLRVYALNLLLIPVNLGGVFKSIEQGITKKKIPFRRTPKVMGRTTSPAAYLVIEIFVLAYLCLGVLVDLSFHRYSHALFGLANSAFFLYAFRRFIGFRNAIRDIRLAFEVRISSRKVQPAEGKCLCPECVLSLGGPADDYTLVSAASC